MLAHLLLSTAFAACGPDTPDNAGFRDALERLWATGAQDEAAYRAEMFELQQAIACLPDAVEPADAARFHRNRALASSLSGDEEAARAAAAAADRIDPEAAAQWRTSSERFAGWLAGQRDPRPLEEFPTSLAARALVDGRAIAARQGGQPAIVQVFAPDGTLVGAAWVDGRSAMPEWVAFPPPSCDGRIGIEQLLEDVDRAELAFAALDVPSFDDALQRVASGLPCLDQVLRPTQAAAIHRLEGLRLFTQGTRLGVVRSFQEAQILDPAYMPPEALSREGSTLAALWDRAGSAPSPPWLPVDVPAGVELRVDGIPSDARPATLPGIVQATSTSGRVLWTGYVPGGVALPEIRALVGTIGDASVDLPPALALYRRERSERTRTNIGRALQLGGAAALLGAGVLYGLNAEHISRYRDPTTPPDALTRQRDAANLTAATSTGLLVLGAAGLGLSFAIR